MLRLGSRRHGRPAGPGYRVRYNLACLFSRQAAARRSRIAYGALERAEEQLVMALDGTDPQRRAGLCRWAWHDPGLEALRGLEGSRQRARFAQIVGPREPRVEQTTV